MLDGSRVEGVVEEDVGAGHKADDHGVELGNDAEARSSARGASSVPRRSRSSHGSQPPTQSHRQRLRDPEVAAATSSLSLLLGRVAQATSFGLFPLVTSSDHLAHEGLHLREHPAPT